MDKEIYLKYTYLDFYMQMIIPSISEVYPIEDMVYQNRNCGKFIRHAVLNFKEEDHEVYACGNHRALEVAQYGKNTSA